MNLLRTKADNFQKALTPHLNYNGLVVPTIVTDAPSEPTFVARDPQFKLVTMRIPPFGQVLSRQLSASNSRYSKEKKTVILLGSQYAG